MPYIKPEFRKLIDASSDAIESCGDFNYFVTTLCLNYLAQTGRRYHDYNFVMGKLADFELSQFNCEDTFGEYTEIIRTVEWKWMDRQEFYFTPPMTKEELRRYNDWKVNLRGAYRCASMEMYRRMIAPYEDTKIAENGDVYPVDNTPLVWNTFIRSKPL